MSHEEDGIERIRPKRTWVKYYLSGYLGSTFVGWLLLAVPYGMIAESPPFWKTLGVSIYFLPAGLLAGFIGERLDRKFTISLTHKIVFLILTFILGIGLAIGIAMVIVQ